MSERIEKILARELNQPRSRVKTLLQKGQVTVDGVVARAGQQADPDTQEICLAGEPIACRAFVYLMLNKPTGVLSATDGKGEPTVLDFVPSALRRKGLFPAGRLDKDTTGFVLLTDDGAFAHRILSPRSHIPKTYIATLDKPVPPTAAAAFAGGMEMDGKVLQPAQLTILSADPPRAQVVLRQGIYHQVKRMFARVGCTVTAPHRHGRVGTGFNAGAGGLSCIDPGGGGAVGKRHRTIGVKNCAATTYCGFGVKKSAVYASRTKNNKNFCRKVAI